MADVDPYLPPPEPSDNPAVPKNQTRKTLVLWLVLIVMFVAIYNFMRPDHAADTEVVEACTSSGWSPWSLAPFAITVLIFGWLWRLVRAGKGYHRATNEATLHLADGDLEGARQGFLAQVEALKGSQNQTQARMNLAWVLQRLGRFDEEREQLMAIERAPGLLFASEQRLVAAASLARHFALCGELARAEAWLADGKKRRERVPSAGLFVVAQLRLAEVIVLARKDALAQALAMLEKDWARMEAGLTASAMKALHVLRAYLLTSIEGPRGEGAATQWLTRAKPARPDELAYLWVKWPALSAWATAHDLTHDVADRAVMG